MLLANFNGKEHLRHRAVSLRQHGFLVRDVITGHLDRHHLIKDSQHGFRRGRSCTTNLLEFLGVFTEAMNEKESVDVIFLDFAKAFDTVPHKRLLAKLEAHGLGGKVLRWIEAWLTGRMQRVCLDGCSSAWVYILSGVPQGSVLGPLLFLIFINDLEYDILSLILKFADDIKVFGRVSNCAQSKLLQDDLDKLCAWADMLADGV